MENAIDGLEQVTSKCGLAASLDVCKNFRGTNWVCHFETQLCEGKQQHVGTVRQVRKLLTWVICLEQADHCQLLNPTRNELTDR